MTLFPTSTTPSPSPAPPHPSVKHDATRCINCGLLLVMLLVASGCSRSPDPEAETAAQPIAAEMPASDPAPAAATPTPTDVRAPAPPPPTATTPEQKAAVVRKLNTIPIAFDSGAGTVSEDSLQGVADAARALATTPDLRVQIALPAAGNEALARQRAEALKVQLIINGIRPGAIDTRVLPAGGSTGATTVSFTTAVGPPR